MLRRDDVGGVSLLLSLLAYGKSIFTVFAIRGVQVAIVMLMANRRRNII